MFQTPDRDTLSLLKSSDFTRYLDIAKKHFPDFFDSNDQYHLLKPQVENQLFNYAVLCQYIPNNIENLKMLIMSLLELFEKAYQSDRLTTINIMVMAATDFDISAVKNAHLTSEYKKIVDNKASMLPRDLAFKLMDNIETLIEGVLKKRLWPLLACQDIIKKVSKSPERWRNEDLGNIVAAIKAMPKPIGEILGGDPIDGITLNQLRNIGAHKDFEIKDGKIILQTLKFHKTETINTLFSVFDELRIRLTIAIIVLRITFIKHINDLNDAGYEPGAYLPENSTTTLGSQLSDSGIILHSVIYNDRLVTARCFVQDDKINPIDALNICFDKIFIIRNVYWGTYTENPDDIFNIVVVYKNGMNASVRISRKDWHSLIKERDSLITIEYSLAHEKIFLRYNPENKKWTAKVGMIWWKSLPFKIFGRKPQILSYWIDARDDLFRALREVGI